MTKILVADDEVDLEMLIKQKFRRQIREHKYEFYFALNGEEALQQYLRHLEKAQEKRLKVASWVKSVPRPRFRLVS